jgi:hypothetical protein
MQCLTEFFVQISEFTGPQGCFCLCAYIARIFFFLDEREVEMTPGFAQLSDLGGYPDGLREV